MSLSDNLQAYWKFDEASGNASDATGNGFTLTNTGATAFAAAKINNGVDFGTTNSTKYFSRSGTIVADSSSYSVSVWVKQRTEIAADSQTFFFFSTPSTAMYLTYEYNGGSRRLVLYRIRNNLPNITTSYTVTLGTANFYHIVATYSGSEIVLYVNNVAVASTAASGNGTSSWTVGTGAVAIGVLLNANDLTATQYASAYADEMAVWSRSLDTADVANLYVSGVGNQHPFNTVYSLTAEVGALTLRPQQARIYYSSMSNVSKPSSSMTNLSKP